MSDFFEKDDIVEETSSFFDQEDLAEDVNFQETDSLENTQDLGDQLVEMQDKAIKSLPGGIAGVAGLEATEQIIKNLPKALVDAVAPLNKEQRDFILKNPEKYLDIIKQSPGDKTALQPDTIKPLLEKVRGMQTPRQEYGKLLKDLGTTIETDKLSDIIKKSAKAGSLKSGQDVADLITEPVKIAQNPIDEAMTKIRGRIRTADVKAEGLPQAVDDKAFSNLQRQEALDTFVNQLKEKDSSNFAEPVFDDAAKAYGTVDPDTKKVILEKVKDANVPDFTEPTYDPETGLVTSRDRTTGRTLTEPTTGKKSTIRIKDVKAPEFLSSEGNKLLKEYNDKIQTLRNRGAQAIDPEDLGDFINELRDKATDIDGKLGDPEKRFLRELEQNVMQEIGEAGNYIDTLKGMTEEGIEQERILKQGLGLGEEGRFKYVKDFVERKGLRIDDDSVNKIADILDPDTSVAKFDDIKKTFTDLGRPDLFDELRLRGLRDFGRGAAKANLGQHATLTTAGGSGLAALGAFLRDKAGSMQKTILESQIRSRTGTGVGGKIMQGLGKGYGATSKLAKGAMVVGGPIAAIAGEGFDAPDAGAPTYADPELMNKIYKASPMELMIKGDALRDMGYESMADTIYSAAEGDQEQRDKLMFQLQDDPGLRRALKRTENQGVENEVFGTNESNPLSELAKKKVNNQGIIEDTVSKEDSGVKRNFFRPQTSSVNLNVKQELLNDVKNVAQKLGYEDMIISSGRRGVEQTRDILTERKEKYGLNNLPKNVDKLIDDILLRGDNPDNINYDSMTGLGKAKRELKKLGREDLYNKIVQIRKSFGGYESGHLSGEKIDIPYSNFVDRYGEVEGKKRAKQFIKALKKNGLTVNDERTKVDTEL